MSYSVPGYIVVSGADTPIIRFLWDDWKASALFSQDASSVGGQIKKLSVRAQVAICIGKLFDWAASINMSVMLCAFENRADGTSEAWHVPLEGADLRRLAR